jgi:activator of HSP90 ATPase
MSLKVGESAAGSVWNKNSWHWEEKNYNKATHDIVKEALESLELKTPSGDIIKLSNVDPKGFASVSVRKGKKIVAFEYEITAEYESGDNKGKLVIPDFSTDELEPVVRVELVSGSDDVKEYIRKSGANEIRKSLHLVVDFINSVENKQEELDADKLRREGELELARRAEAERGEEKMRIATEIKQIENGKIENKTLEKSSVWNTNSYHWETRNLNKWAADWVKAQLADQGVESIEVNGEVEQSIRKGKKICIFNLSISGIFKGSNFKLSEYNNEDGEEEIPAIKWDGARMDELEEILNNRIFSKFFKELQNH